MKYIIMVTIVVGLALADFITGLIKACIKKDVSSQMMRIGGLHKILELVIMLTACGLEIGITALGKYYQSTEIAEKLAEITGALAAGGVFVWIVFMEITSILENYVEANPDAKWAIWMLKKLRVFQQKELEKEEKSNVQTETDKT